LDIGKKSFLLKLKMKIFFISISGAQLGTALSTLSSHTLAIMLAIVHTCMHVTLFSLLYMYVCHCSHLQYSTVTSSLHDLSSLSTSASL
jgi:hypothetical protein